MPEFVLSCEYLTGTAGRAFSFKGELNAFVLLLDTLDAYELFAM